MGLNRVYPTIFKETIQNGTLDSFIRKKIFLLVTDSILEMGDISEGDRSEVPRDAPPSALFKKMVINSTDQSFSDALSQRFSSWKSDGINQNNPAKKAKPATKMRFIVCTLGLMSLAMSQMSRMVLNLSITSMVDPKMLVKPDVAKVSSDGSCPWPEESNNDLTTTQPPVIDPIYFYLTAPPDWSEESNEIANSTSFNEPTTSSQSDTEVSTVSDVVVKIIPNEEELDKFKWTIKQQSVLLGGFYYSYFFFMILGGRLAEVYGAKYILMLAVAGSALINLATPYMARNSFNLLVFSRILMGIIQSGVFPAMYALFNKWLTMSEASIYAPLIKMNLRLGMLLGSLIPGLLPGWPSVFYFTGTVSAIWSIAWFFIATSEPDGNRWVSKEELKHIMKKKAKPIKEEVVEVELKERNSNGLSAERKPKKKASLKTPWLRIITAPSVIALIVVKLTFNYAIDFLAIELPSYLKYVHHASTQKISFLITLMFSIQVVFIVFVGWLAKSVVTRRPFGMTKTTIRKLFQGLASLGIALVMFLMTFNDCNLVFVAVLLQVASFLSMFAAGGETMIPYDLSDEYPATIMAIANSIANVSGVTTTVVAGLILGDQGGSYERWNILIYLIVMVNAVGGLVFILLVKAEPIDLSGSKKKKQSEQKANNDTELGTSESGSIQLDSEAKKTDSKARDDVEKEQKIDEVIKDASEKI